VLVRFLQTQRTQQSRTARSVRDDGDSSYYEIENVNRKSLVITNAQDGDTNEVQHYN
jgi:hypothetical protein